MQKIRPTHVIDWDDTLPLMQNRVLFCDLTLECAIERCAEGGYIAPCFIRMSTGKNRTTGEIENEISLPVLYCHSVKARIIDQLNKGNMDAAFEMFFAYMVTQELKDDASLVEALT